MSGSDSMKYKMSKIKKKNNPNNDFIGIFIESFIFILA